MAAISYMVVGRQGHAFCKKHFAQTDFLRPSYLMTPI